MERTSSFVIILTTYPADRDAGALARALVAERLAACVNVLPPMLSIYRWKGEVEQAEECQLAIKTTADRVDAIRDRVSNLHPYEVPEFLVVPILSGSDAYLGWLAEASGAEA